MNCPQCGRLTESTAAFCGNCGLALKDAPRSATLAGSLAATTIGVSGPAFAPPASPSTPADAVPAYAIASPYHTDIRLVIALVCGIVGIAGSLFAAVLGLVLGIIGLIVATTAQQRGRLKLSGIILSSLAVVVGLAIWASVLSQNSKRPGNLASTSNNSVTGTASTDTPCYSFSFASTFNVDSVNNTCSLNAYNANSLATSSEIYKVLSSQAANLTTTNFNTISKNALEQDIRQSLPGFTITSERATHFANSLAYSINATDVANKVAIQETTVLHKTAQGDNLFVLIHATSGDKTDLGELEDNWQWK